MRLNHSGVQSTASQALGPERNVSLPGKPGLTGSINGTVVNVSDSDMDILKKADRAIKDTWRVLDKGAGNQVHDILFTNGDSIKRTWASRSKDVSYANFARHAAKFRAGNCGEMAAVNALLLASSGIRKPVAVCVALDMDHSFVAVGDRRIRGDVMVSDAWPLFGRADKLDNYALSQRFEIVKEYAPQAADPEVREKLVHGKKYSQDKINELYRRQMRKQGVPIDKKDLNSLKEIASRYGSEPYHIYQSSRDINVTYKTRNDRSLKPEMKESLYESRRRRQDSVTPESEAELRRNLGRAFGTGRS